MDGIEPASAGAAPTRQQILCVRTARMQRVLELWHGGEKSTHCIAAELGMDEADVCHMIEDAEGRAAKFGEGV